MINTSLARRGIAVASHSLAAQSALAVLREGGNALEAMVAAAATIAVVYPHMTGIGGDAFWLVSAPGEEPFASAVVTDSPATKRDAKCLASRLRRTKLKIDCRSESQSRVERIMRSSAP